MGRVDHSLDRGSGRGGYGTGKLKPKPRFPLVYCEMDPGDAMFFDCNILHRSDQNRSEQPQLVPNLLL